MCATKREKKKYILSQLNSQSTDQGVLNFRGRNFRKSWCRLRSKSIAEIRHHVNKIVCMHNLSCANRNHICINSHVGADTCVWYGKISYQNNGAYRSVEGWLMVGISFCFILFSIFYKNNTPKFLCFCFLWLHRLHTHLTLYCNKERCPGTQGGNRRLCQGDCSHLLLQVQERGWLPDISKSLSTLAMPLVRLKLCYPDYQGKKATM